MNDKQDLDKQDFLEPEGTARKRSFIRGVIATIIVVVALCWMVSA